MSYTEMEPKIKEDKLSAFFNHEPVAINCTTKKEAILLFNYLRSKGVTWCSGAPLNNNTLSYNDYDNETCYSYDNRHGLEFGDVDCYEEIAFDIIKFSDLQEE